MPLILFFCWSVYVIGLTEDKICCDMAKDNGNVSCGKLSVDSNKGLSSRCRMSFWKCCMALYGAKGNNNNIIGDELLLNFGAKFQL